MNYAYLLDHIARDFYTNVRLYDNSRQPVKLIRPDDRLQDDALESLILKSPLFEEASPLPLIFTVNHHLHYALVQIPEGRFLLAPVVFITMLPVKQDLSADPGIVSDLLPIIPPNSPELCIDRLLILSNINRTGEKGEPFFTTKDIYDANLISDPKEKDSYEALYGTIFDSVERGFAHNPYNHEHRERVCIQSGDVDGLRKVLKERFPGRYGRLSKDPVKQEIADAIGLESNYLSSLFKKSQGVSLKQYIRHQKIKLVKNLLTYSSYSYSEIAAYLGFASQSHMGQDFKKETGITPRVFRERNASEDFVNDTI